MLHHGDCIDVMAAMEPESVDAVVTDPPYNLVSIGARFGKPGAAPPKDAAFGGRYSRLAGGFMGKTWDGAGIAFRVETWEAVKRVAKPGAYLLALGGTRTYHRMVCAIEDAGWDIRDSILWGSWLGGWVHAQGFPKSKSSLKPAWEPIVLARKPGPLRELAIDACRIPLTGSEAPGDRDGEPTAATRYGDKVRATPGRRLIQGVHDRRPVPGGLGEGSRAAGQTDLGRWPANVILTDPIFDGDVPGVVGGGRSDAGGNINGRPVTGYGGHWADSREFDGYGDAGTYSRFFLVPKADRAEREPVLGGLPLQIGGSPRGAETRPDRPTNHPLRANHHPTVKPLDLMRHLVRLVTPPDGTVLDMFAGSGTTLLAAEMEGFRWIGVEKEAEYVAIAEARLNGTQRGLGLPA